jgi:2'-5' RNA ligase
VTATTLRPSALTALVIAVRLPPGLEALRMRSIRDAPDGVPAHITLLYPFADESQIDATVRAVVERIVARHRVGILTLGERRLFPDTIYASVEPDAPLRALQAELAGAFPELPLYGGAHAFEPHVSIVEGPSVDGSPDAADAAWQELPTTAMVDAVELITNRDGRWAMRHRFPMRAPRPS